MPRSTTYTDAFKRQIVAKKKSGKTVTYLMREYKHLTADRREILFLISNYDKC